MSESTSLQLYKWITEEMCYFPKKRIGAEKSEIVLTPHDLDFLMGSKKDLWDHVMKHVHSVSKVQHIRKNILLSRLKKNKFQGIQKCDEVGNKINLLSEVKHVQVQLEKAREEARESEKLLRSQRSLLKIAGCQRHHLQNIADNTERRCILLKMSAEKIRALTDAVKSSLKSIPLQNVQRTDMPSSNIQDHSSIEFEEESTTELSYVPVPLSFECKRFIDKCFMMAKDLLDEKLEAVGMEKASSNSSVFSDFSQLCIDSRFTDVDNLKFHNAISDTKKNELKSFISNNMKNYPVDYLLGSMLSLLSAKNRSVTVAYDDHHFTMYQKMYGEERINELESLLKEKMTHFHASITHDFVVAAQDKVMSSRMRNELKKMMSSIGKDIHKMFPDNEMQEKVYGLIELMTQEASLTGAIAYLRKSLNDMLMDSSPDQQIKKLDDQLKTMENEMSFHKNALERLQRMQEEVSKNILSNHEEVRRCLVNTDIENIKRILGDKEFLLGLPKQELLMFNEYPLECHRKSLFMGKEVMDSRLLINGHVFSDKLCEKENCYAQWVKLTLGMAPYSSTEHILAVLFKTKGITELLSGPAQHFETEMLQSIIAKIPVLLKFLEEDEKKSENVLKKIFNAVNVMKSATKKELEVVNIIYNIWMEEKINKCVPECDLYEGKTFLQWYYDICPLLQKEK